MEEFRETLTKNGTAIYDALKKRYPEQNEEHLNMILNTLVIAIGIHIFENMESQYYKASFKEISKQLKDVVDSLELALTFGIDNHEA